jgi:hypothetical protein
VQVQLYSGWFTWDDMIWLMSHRIARFFLGFYASRLVFWLPTSTGVWAGQQQGRLGRRRDVAFRWLNGGHGAQCSAMSSISRF